MANDFYKAFEDKFRGSSAEIRSRLSVYSPFLRALKLAESEPHVCLDIGCGRGEWLELLAEEGFSASGVDLNESMVQHCKSRGLKAEYKDALAALKEVPSDSLCVVSGFHIAEHLPFDVLQDIFREAFRTLRPNGLLIFETPNPENLMVGSHYFYLDPTHSKPIPMQLLAFAAEYIGFARVKTLRLNAPRSNHRGLLMVLSNVSPDYAVVGQKHSNHSQSQIFDELFQVDLGTSISDATADYDKNIIELQSKIGELTDRLARSELKLQRIHFIISPLDLVFKTIQLLKKNGLKAGSIELLKKSKKSLITRSRNFFHKKPFLKKLLVTLLPRALAHRVKYKLKLEHQNVSIEREELSAYASEFYNSLKSVRAQK